MDRRETKDPAAMAGFFFVPGPGAILESIGNSPAQLDAIEFEVTLPN